MSRALVIGNFVRGFRVITGFITEEDAHNFCGDNKELVGSEYRVALSGDYNDILQALKKEEAGEALQFEKPVAGEVVDPATGLSTDIQDHKSGEEDANISSDGQDQGGAAAGGAGDSGDDKVVPGLSGVSGPVSGDGSNIGDSGPNADGGTEGGNGDGVNN